MNGGSIHYEDPFVDPPSERSPARRLRGRLALPVTVWTAGRTGEEAGLTISSLTVADGEPPVVTGLVGDTTDLFGAVIDTQTFVVHVLRAEDARLAEIFAGLRPNPGGPFAGLRVTNSDWGPLLESHGTRAYCRLREVADSGYQKLLIARVEKIDLDEIDDPAVYFRGRFRRLAPDARRPSS
jgi:3-hydroxy-9,10-secoandrosta-1,3,5(10)-triene-9,17-dione monooxygenase reductase component